MANSGQCLELSDGRYSLNTLPEYKSIKFHGDEVAQIIEMVTERDKALSWLKYCKFKLDGLHHGGSIYEDYFGNSSIGIIVLNDNTLIKVAITHKNRL